MEADILIEPDAPADLLLVIDRKLILQKQITTFVNLIRLLSVILVTGVDGPKLAVPNWQTPVSHPLCLLEVPSPDSRLLFFRSSIRVGRRRESIEVVIVDRVDAVGPAFMELSSEAREVRGESVSIQVDDMFIIDGVDSLDASVVPHLETRVSGIRWLVENVVSCDPRVSFVMFGEFLPEPNGTVLEVFVHPE